MSFRERLFAPESWAVSRRNRIREVSDGDRAGHREYPSDPHPEFAKPSSDPWRVFFLRNGSRKRTAKAERPLRSLRQQSALAYGSVVCDSCLIGPSPWGDWR